MELLQKFIERNKTTLQGVGFNCLINFQIIIFIHYYIGIDCGFQFILHYLQQISFAKNKHTTYIHTYSSISIWYSSATR